MNADWRSRYELAVDAARRAGDLARTIYHDTFDVEVKLDLSPVTIADRNVEALIRSLVKQHFPADALLGEEHGEEPGTTGFRWVIDPIDGTKSFIRNIPLWGTLVGLEYHGEAIAGVCYAPGLGQLWRALRGDGAYRDETRIRVSSVTALSEALLCYSGISWFTRNNKEKAFLELAAQTAGQRGYGDYYGFMLVAQGSADLMVDCGLEPWDAAAPRAIVEEAGGSFTDWLGRPTRYDPDVLASNCRLHSALLDVLGPSAGPAVANRPAVVNNNVSPPGPRPEGPA